jgi:hypothetical protein
MRVEENAQTTEGTEVTEDSGTRNQIFPSAAFPTRTRQPGTQIFITADRN